MFGGGGGGMVRSKLEELFPTTVKHFVHATVHNTVLLPHYNGDTIGMFSLLAAEQYKLTL